MGNTFLNLQAEDICFERERVQFSRGELPVLGKGTMETPESEAVDTGARQEHLMRANYNHAKSGEESDNITG